MIPSWVIQILEECSTGGWSWEIAPSNSSILNHKNLDPVENRFSAYACHDSWLTNDIQQAIALPEFLGPTIPDVMTKLAVYIQQFGWRKD